MLWEKGRPAAGWRHLGFMLGPIVIAVSGMAIAVLAPQTAHAAAPPNDAFATADPLSGASDTATGTNMEATKESGEPYHANNAGGASVWYAWTAPTTGRYAIGTCGSDFDTLLAVYHGTTVNNLGAPLGQNDQSFGADCPDSDQSEVIVYAYAGMTYRIVVDGFAPPDTYTPERGQVALTLEPATPPSNDAFNAAELLSGLSDSTTGTNRYATRETGEPGHPGAGGASVWYSWTAPATGRFRIDTCGSNYPTSLGVYTGTAVNALTHVAGNFGGCGGRSRVVIDATIGTVYRIAVDGENFDPDLVGAPWMGDIGLAIRPASPPPNDNRGNPAILSGISATVTGTNLDATSEAGELFWEPGGASVWYRWTAPSAGWVTLNACGSDFDTTLAVYIGGSSMLTHNDDGAPCPGPGSHLMFYAQAGATYDFSLDGYRADEGNIHLAMSQVPTSPPGSQSTSTPVTGERARALRKCAKKRGQARQRCRKKAKRLPE